MSTNNTWDQNTPIGRVLSLKDPPVLPNGISAPRPESEYQLQKQLQIHSIKRSISYILSCITRTREKRKQTAGEDEKIWATLYLYRLCGNKCRRNDFIRYREVLQRVDVIAICFDRSKPETLHNALYKVRGIHYSM
jgi:hypothetical protein